eukprot:COSAG06_NODE_58856_length_276_cov_0.559322_1_plen_20_part_10
MHTVGGQQARAKGEEGRAAW